VREKLIALEKEHMLAVDAMEATFEKRLQLQKQESHARLANMEDNKFCMEETLQRVNRACMGAARLPRHSACHYALDREHVTHDHGAQYVWAARAEVHYVVADKVMEVQQQMEQKVSESVARCELLKREGDAAQTEFVQVMEQAEMEFDDNTDRLKQELLALQRSAKEKEEDLNAQIRVYTRYVQLA
jgi:hypothetical protein